MSFDSEDPRISAYLFDELAPDERAAFESELERSTELQRLVQQTREVIEALQMDFAQGAPLHLSDRQRAALASEVSVESASQVVSVAGPPPAADKRSHPRRAVWVAIGGICILLGGVVVSARMSLQTERSHALVAQHTSHSERVLFDDSAVISSDEKSHPTTADSGTYADYESAMKADAYSGDGESLVELDDIQLLFKESVLEETDKQVEVVPADVYGEEMPVIQTKKIHQGLTESLSQLQSLSKTEFGAVIAKEEAISRHEHWEFRADSLADQGAGPGEGGDKYELIVENDFLRVPDAPLSTFSIDVDTASYAKVRIYLMEHQQLPRPDAVRIEELVNYFPYGYAAPESEQPFSAAQAVATCPWNPEHRLVRIGIKGKAILEEDRPPSNLVFLLDVSGSMDEPNKLPLLKRGMEMLVDQFAENDRVAIVVYAGAAGMVLDSTTGDHKAVISQALDRLKAGGSTNGGTGLQLAYQMALDHFISGGVNRVILCTDGDFNVGTTGTDELVRIVEQHSKSGVYLSVLGFGMGNHNDSMLEQISGRGNGNYSFVDTDREARKVLVEQMSGTLMTIAKDVKIQVEFNPAQVAAYRLIGYENRILAAQDFNDDTKDAGEIGAGHTVTALYEVVPVGKTTDVAPPVDDLKYQQPTQLTEVAHHSELLTLKIRYKQPDEDESKLLSFTLKDANEAFSTTDADFQFAAAVASFGMLLRDSKYKGNATYASVAEIATVGAKNDTIGYRQEFLELVRAAAQLAGEPTN